MHHSLSPITLVFPQPLLPWMPGAVLWSQEDTFLFLLWKRGTLPVHFWACLGVPTRCLTLQRFRPRTCSFVNVNWTLIVRVFVAGGQTLVEGFLCQVQLGADISTIARSCFKAVPWWPGPALEVDQDHWAELRSPTGRLCWCNRGS